MDVSFKNKIFGSTLHLVGQLASRTCRFQFSGLEHWETQQATGKPAIFLAWHGMSMMLAAFFQSKLDVSNLIVMMPNDWRGEALYHWQQKMGSIAIPMDLENKGMGTARKFAGLVREVKKGRHAYITPDGPDGPSYVLKPGTMLLARKTGAPILPVGAYTRAGYVLNRWDCYTAPYPFGRISIVLGAPITVPRGAEAEQVHAQLRIALHDVTMQAAANYYAGRH